MYDFSTNRNHTGWELTFWIVISLFVPRIILQFPIIFGRKKYPLTNHFLCGIQKYDCVFPFTILKHIVSHLMIVHYSNCIIAPNGYNQIFCKAWVRDEKISHLSLGYRVISMLNESKINSWAKLFKYFSI